MTAIDIVLVGGARDGEEMTISATERLVLPRLDVKPYASLEQALLDSPVFERDVYRRDVVSDRTHRWRYVLERQERGRAGSEAS